MKDRIPHRWTVLRHEGNLVRNTVHVTKTTAVRVADRAREAGHRAEVLFNGVAIA